MAWNRDNCALVLALLSYAGWESASEMSRALQREPSVRRGATAEQPRQAQEVWEKIRVRSDLVVLSVTVNDSRGNLVSGLRQEDFHVFDDEVEQRIVAFTDEGLPLSLVLLIDKDMKWKEGTEMTKSLRAMAAGMSDADEAMVCRYDMLFYPGEGFTSVTGNLISALKDAQNGAQPPPQYVPGLLITEGGSTTGPPNLAAPTYAGSRPSKALDDAIYSSAELLRDRGGDRRRLILVVSDGVNEPKLNKHTHKDILELLLRNNISVYGVAVGTDKAKSRLFAMADYATETGGDIFYATKSGEMENLYSQIMERARHDYTVVYVPTGNEKGSAFHALKVTTRTGLTASTRRGYYSGNPEIPKE
jgi:VWFA-related protein